MTKQQLLDESWPGINVGEGVLTECIHEIRKALGDSPKNPKFIETVHRRGYRFIEKIVESHFTTNESTTKIMTKMDAQSTHSVKPQPQCTRWGPDDDLPPGITIDDDPGMFIPWEDLKEEIEKKLLFQVKEVPIHSKVILGSIHGRENWIVKIMDPNGKEVGHVWFGNNPFNDIWDFDGLVRVGEAFWRDPTPVWQTFRRYSNSTYRRVRGKSGPKNI